MDLTEELARLRAERESMMTDTCVVTRAGVPDPGAERDPDTGLFPVPADVTVYTGKCSIKVTNEASTSIQSAGDVASVLAAVASVPVDAPRIEVKDRITWLTSAYNPRLVGMRFTVDGLIPGSRQTAQKVSVEVVVD